MLFLPLQQNTCNIRYKEEEYICCDPNISVDIEGFTSMGYIYVIFSVINWCYFENTLYGWGLFSPNSTIFYKNRISPMGVVFIVLGLCGLASYATVLPAICLMSTGAVYCVAAHK